MLETCRITLLLAHSACVVSERSSADPRVDAQYEAERAVVFVDEGDFAALGAQCRALLNDDAARAEQCTRAAQFAANPLHSTEHCLRDVIVPLREHFAKCQ